eukprot:397415_1
MALTHSSLQSFQISEHLENHLDMSVQTIAFKNELISMNDMEHLFIKPWIKIMCTPGSTEKRFAAIFKDECFLVIAPKWEVLTRTLKAALCDSEKK